MPGQWVRCLPSDYWRKENISCKALWFLSLFQNLVRLHDLVLIVQPGAKINSVYYCKNVLKQGLLPAIRRVSNNDFVFQQDGAPAHRSHHTVAYLRSNAPEFIEPENWPQYSPDLNTADYSVWRRCSRWCNVTKFKTLIRRSKFWAQLSQDTLNRWLISCRRNWGWLSRQRVVMLNFV